MNIKDMTIEEYMKEKQKGKSFRLKVEYKGNSEEDEYRFDLRRAIEESQR